MQDFPVVTTDIDALTATRLLVERALPGLVVLDADGLPLVVLPASQVLRFALPDYIDEDPTLARVIPGTEADQLCRALSGHTVAQLMPDKAYLPRRDADRPIVTPNATVMENASVMSRQHSPMVAVTEKGRVLPVFRSCLIDQPSWAADGDRFQVGPCAHLPGS